MKISVDNVVTAAPPFGLPDLITVTLDLPFPPSMNRLWRASFGPGPRVRLSEEYKAWKDQADRCVLANGTYRTRFWKKPILGRFEALLQLNDEMGKKADCDNLSKAPLDWCQSRGLIANDKNCRRLTVEWVEHAMAPDGARLTLREMART